MVKDPTPVDIVFQDIKDALDALIEAKDSPKQTRQIFCQFVNITKKLSAYMRKGSSANKIDLSEFEGWNDVSTLFYSVLRNADEHDNPITLKINYVWRFKTFGGVPAYFDVHGYWEGNNALDEFHSDEFVSVNHETGEELQPESVSFQYNLNYDKATKSGRKIEEYLTLIGHGDIHKLAEEYFYILSAFVDYYNDKVSG